MNNQRSRMENAFASQLEIRYLPSNLTRLLVEYSSSDSISMESVLAGLLVNVGSICSNSCLKISTRYKESLSLYIVLSGHPGTNKSSAINLAKDSMSEIEKFFGDIFLKHMADKNFTTINSSITVESLVTELQKSNQYFNGRLSSLVQYWDEFETLAKSFGLYKSGGASFDRSIYNTLYNGAKELTQTTKSSNIKLTNPRLSIFGAGHPMKMIKRFEEERNADLSCDGLYARFLVLNPIPKRSKLSELKNHSGYTIKMLRVLIIIRSLHIEPKEYEFDDEAFQYAEEIHMEFDRICDEHAYDDPYVSFVYSKAKGQYLRLASIIWIITKVLDLAQNLDQNIFDDPKSIIDYFSNEENMLPLKIDIRSSMTAQNIMMYFIKQKMFLSGYDFDGDNLIPQPKKTINIVPEAATRVLRETEILSTNKLSFFNDDFATRTDFKHFQAAIYKLQEENLGKVVTKKKDPSRQRSALCFMKVSPPNEDATLLKFVDNLSKYNVDLDTYNTVDAPSTSKRKRTESEHETSSPKKAKSSEV